jgi:hypothetical protein
MDVREYLDVQSAFRYQAMAMGMPGAVPTHAYSQISRYGVRGWKGMTWGLSNIPGRIIGSGSRRVLAKYPSWQPVHNVGSTLGQILGGGKGAGGAIVGFGGNPHLFQFALGTAEKTAIAESLFNQGVSRSAAFHRGLAVRAMDVGVVQGAHNRVVKSMLAAGESMGLRESFSTMLTGRSSTLEVAVGQAIGYKPDQQVNQLVSRAGARNIGASRFLGLAARPMLGALNAIFVAQMAFKGAQTLGHVAVGVNKQI